MTTLQSQLTRGLRYRHVRFAGAAKGRELLNVAPARSSSPALPAPPRLSAEEDSFIQCLFDLAALDARIYRCETLRRRLPACLRALRANSLAHAKHILLHNRMLVDVAVSAMVIGVTSFYRDAAVFDHLASSVLPALGKASRSLRVWSVGCSDGDELYSVAILLAEMQMLEDSFLLGNDCRPGAIDRAREGLYAPEALREIPAVWLDQYFDPCERKWRVRNSLRAVVRWRTLDVTRLGEPGAWDLILCRNMAMYLRSEVSGRLWEMFERGVRPGGFLVLGKAERPVGAARFSPVAPCIYRRT